MSSAQQKLLCFAYIFLFKFVHCRPGGGFGGESVLDATRNDNGGYGVSIGVLEPTRNDGNGYDASGGVNPPRNVENGYGPWLNPIRSDRISYGVSNGDVVRSGYGISNGLTDPLRQIGLNDLGYGGIRSGIGGNGYGIGGLGRALGKGFGAARNFPSGYGGYGDGLLPPSSIVDPLSLRGLVDGRIGGGLRNGYGGQSLPVGYGDFGVRGGFGDLGLPGGYGDGLARTLPVIAEPVPVPAPVPVPLIPRTKTMVLRGLRIPTRPMYDDYDDDDDDRYGDDDDDDYDYDDYSDPATLVIRTSSFHATDKKSGRHVRKNSRNHVNYYGVLKRLLQNAKSAHLQQRRKSGSHQIRRKSLVRNVDSSDWKYIPSNLDDYGESEIAKRYQYYRRHKKHADSD